MDDARDLGGALDFLDPAVLSYTEWTVVGMAIKEEGLPLDIWENWSRRDSARFHPGECEAKWASFKGAANPVTLASVFDMAYKNGYAPSGHELDWDSEISFEKDNTIVSPGWVEDRDLVIPETWDPADQLIRYLQALFEPTENVGYCTQSWQKEGRWMPTSGAYDRTAGKLIEALAACGGDIGAVVGDYNREAGAWIRFNPLDGNGCKNDNVTEYRFALVESDNIDLARQNALIRELQLPVAALVYSGKKSLHAIVRVEAPNYTEYQKRVEYLYAVCRKNGLTLDTQNKNPSRLSRMPGIMRGDQKQYLLDTNIGKASWAEWKEWVEESTDDLPDTESMASVWENLPPLAPPLIQGVLRQGHKLLLAGPSKAGKSFALIELTIAIAEGERWMGRFPCAQGRVLYVNLELDRPSCLHRFRDVYRSLDIPAAHLGNIDLWNLRGASVPMDKLAPKLIRRAQKRGYIAVIIDPIYKVITGDENSAEQMSKFCNQFDRIARELNCAVICCHHHSKGAQGDKTSRDRASGSGVFARDPDALLDMIQLDVTDTLLAHEEDKAECAVRMEALRKKGLADSIGPDDALSPAQLRKACSEAAVVIDSAVKEAREAARTRTAWRVEGTLREFARFDPIDLWFDYPVHRPDESGVLGDVSPEGAAPAWKKAIVAHKRSAADRKGDQNRGLEAAFDAVKSLGDVPTLYNLAEYMGVSPKTVKRRVAAHGGYWLDGSNVGKK